MMKKAEEYLSPFYNGKFIELHSGDVEDIIIYIKQAQRDAIDNALREISCMLPEVELDWVDFQDFSLGCERVPTSYKEDLEDLKQQLFKEINDEKP